MEDIVIALITAGVPSAFTFVTALFQHRYSSRNFAKQTILSMIMEDEFGYEMYRKLPVNYIAIQNEYNRYHKFGGNGEVTKKVIEYNDWYSLLEEGQKKINNK